MHELFLTLNVKCTFNFKGRFFPHLTVKYWRSRLFKEAQLWSWQEKNWNGVQLQSNTVMHFNLLHCNILVAMCIILWSSLHYPVLIPTLPVNIKTYQYHFEKVRKTTVANKDFSSTRNALKIKKGSSFHMLCLRFSVTANSGGLP